MKGLYSLNVYFQVKIKSTQNQEHKTHPAKILLASIYSTMQVILSFKNEKEQMTWISQLECLNSSVA